jgi:hypothetical protein
MMIGRWDGVSGLLRMGDTPRLTTKPAAGGTIARATTVAQAVSTASSSPNGDDAEKRSDSVRTGSHMDMVTELAGVARATEAVTVGMAAGRLEKGDGSMGGIVMRIGGAGTAKIMTDEGSDTVTKTTSGADTAEVI